MHVAETNINLKDLTQMKTLAIETKYNVFIVVQYTFVL